MTLALGGCATSSGTMAGDRNLITEEELASTTATNVYEVIDRLRPLWLHSGGPRSIALETEIAVIVDGSYFGSLQALRTVSPQGVWRIRYIGDAAEAAAAMPRLTTSRVVEAAILISIGRE
jgi:hypothetical protein